MEILNNREIVGLFYLLILFLVIFVWYFKSPSIRDSINGVVKSALHPILISVFLAQIIYIAITLIPLFVFDLWFNLLIKDLVVWFFGSAIVLTFNINKVTSWKYFRDVILQTLAITVFFEFIIQQFPFSLLVELILQPIVTIIILLQVVANTKEEYKPVKRLLDVVVSGLGLFFIGRALYLMVTTWEHFAIYQNLMSFLLPIIMTFAFLPYIYLLAVYANYDKLLHRKHGRLFGAIKKDDKSLQRHTCWQILKACNLNLGRWWKFDSEYANKLFSAKNKGDVDEVISSFRKSLSKHSHYKT